MKDRRVCNMHAFPSFERDAVYEKKTVRTTIDMSSTVSCRIWSIMHNKWSERRFAMTRYNDLEDIIIPHELHHALQVQSKQISVLEAVWVAFVGLYFH